MGFIIHKMKKQNLSFRHTQEECWNELFGSLSNVYLLISPELLNKITNLNLTCIFVKRTQTVCLFVVCLFGVLLPTREYSLIWRRHHNRWRTSNFDLCSAPMATEQWGFFSLPHLYCDTEHPFVMVNNPRTGTRAPVNERLAVELSLSVLTA